MLREPLLILNVGYLLFDKNFQGFGVCLLVAFFSGLFPQESLAKEKKLPFLILCPQRSLANQVLTLRGRQDLYYL